MALKSNHGRELLVQVFHGWSYSERNMGVARCQTWRGALCIQSQPVTKVGFLFIIYFKNNMENKKENISKKNIITLLVVIIIILISGFFVYPEYSRYRFQKEIEHQQARQEASEKSMLITEIDLLQMDLGEFEYTSERQKQMSLEELRNAKQELEWKMEFNTLKRKCGDDCPENLTWGNFLLSKVLAD